jgi:hypothetical protein
MSTAQPIDVRDMAIIHRTFRRTYDESARLVRAAPAPSPGRVAFLADHIDFAILALHIHHEGEDELLYPKLIERVPDQALMTEEVEHEHQLVRTALDAASIARAVSYPPLISHTNSAARNRRPQVALRDGAGRRSASCRSSSCRRRVASSSGTAPCAGRLR